MLIHQGEVLIQAVLDRCVRGTREVDLLQSHGVGGRVVRVTVHLIGHPVFQAIERVL